MSDLKTYTGFFKNSVTIAAYSIYTLDFSATKPNHYIVNNTGSGTIYCSTVHTPTTSNFDFAVAGGKARMYAEPFTRTTLSILNPTGSAVTVNITSFAAEFNPATLALASLDIDFSGMSIKADTEISSFATSLPAGSNKIGSVGISGAIPAGSNKIGSVDLSGTALTVLQNILTACNSINEKLVNAETTGY